MPAAAQRIYGDLKEGERQRATEAVALEGVPRPTALRHLARPGDGGIGGWHGDPRAHWTSAT